LKLNGDFPPDAHPADIPPKPATAAPATAVFKKSLRFIYKGSWTIKVSIFAIFVRLFKKRI
jgi:hypothetical protein